MGSSGQPGDGPDSLGPPIRPCSKWGLAVAASPQSTGRSYRPISPLPPGFDTVPLDIVDRTFSGSRRRYVSVLLSVPRSDDHASSKAWELPSTLSGGARTFLPGGIPSAAAVIQTIWSYPMAL